ncbi:N-acetylglucosamine-6-phosphate deacetylase [Plantactinospora sp. GCM10030261]|uniref:N-acetylglucosamine-6-phosphate deacetylase n=1 Tax=Plantactinospora sp. GCM10030261 TaxID=3273420 RepID=UPI003617FE0B
MVLRVNGQVVTPTGVIQQGCVEIDGERIIAVAEYPSVRDGNWIVPGFVDMHTHGGGGHTFTTADPESARRAADFHLARGTTTMLASLVSSPIELIREAVTGYAPLVAERVLAGIHLEGPYLAAARCGAQNPEYLRDPAPEELAELLDLGAGSVRMVTVAPERPGALEMIKMLVSRGVVAAVGHTDATYQETRAAIEAGATVGTHVFNGMRPPHHREPGPAFALLAAPDVICELIADGVHMHDGTLAFAAATTGPDRAALVTDAMAAAGMPDGAYELGGQAVTVADGVARLATAGEDEESGAIAGSTLTMDAALRRAVGAGIAIPDACRMASATPARALGIDDQIGSLLPGWRADLVELDEDLRVVRVMRAGTWID